ncbi:PAS domain-containing protein [Herbaspirillum sp. GCM10030257]|uniref:PAS domain-containing protein n=1 Tax=Herbaspirillum sp. GCM10030257 TaxID=3273393 RepID=UPI00361D530C
MSTDANVPVATLYQRILESMPEALILSDLEGTIKIWNAGAASLFGYASDEALGRSLNLIIPDHLRKAHWDGFHQAIMRGSTAHGKRSAITRSLHKGGQQLYVDMSFAVVSDSDGKIIGALAVARDATERYVEERNLRRQLAEMKSMRHD